MEIFVNKLSPWQRRSIILIYVNLAVLLSFCFVILYFSIVVSVSVCVSFRLEPWPHTDWIGKLNLVSVLLNTEYEHKTEGDQVICNENHAQIKAPSEVNSKHIWDFPVFNLTSLDSFPLIFHMAVSQLCCCLAASPPPLVLSSCLSDIFSAPFSCVLHHTHSISHCCDPQGLHSASCWTFRQSHRRYLKNLMKSPWEQILYQQRQPYSYLCNYAFTIKEQK